MTATWPGPHVWTRDPFVALDTETTGLDPGKGARVVELALVRVERLRPAGTLSLLLNPGEEALAAFRGSRAAGVNRIDPALLAAAPGFRDVAGRVADFLEDLPILAYNAPFDVAFLRAEFWRVDPLGRLPGGLSLGGDGVERALDPNVWVRDVDRFVRKRSPTDRRHSLLAAAERRGLRPEGEAHRAETDALLALALARALARERRNSIPRWTARLLRKQARRRAAQDEARRNFYAKAKEGR